MMQLRINGRIWLEADANERFMGIGRLELLQRIKQTGSISQAAKAMNMSYKRAWDLVQSMNTLAQFPLITTQTGGSAGGGAVISAEGEKYLTYYQGLHERFQQFMATEAHLIPA